MLHKVRDFLNENKNIQSLRRFYGGELYLAIVALATVVAYCFSIELLIAPILIIFCSAGLIISKDFKPYIIILLLFVYMIPPTHMKPDSGAFTNSFYYKKLPLLIFYAILILLALIARFVIHGGFTKVFKTKTRLTFFIIPLTIAFMINGAFSEDYKIGNLIFGITMAFCMCFLYLIIVHNIDYDETTVTYFCKVCFYIALVLIAELIFVYATGDFIENGSVQKGFMYFGWGICNNYGAMICILIPPVLYLVMNEKHWYVFYLVAALSYAATLLSFCRAAMLVGSAGMIIGFVSIMLFGKNAKKCTIANCALATVAIILLILKRQQLSTLFNLILTVKLDDSGRFDLWKLAIENFLNHPIFGGGFYSCEFVSRGFLPSFYHNTVIEMMAATGAFGLVAYLAFRGMTVFLCFRKFNTEKLFLGLMLAVLLGTSLLDNHIFNVYPLFYHAVLIALIELDYNKYSGKTPDKKSLIT